MTRLCCTASLPLSLSFFYHRPRRNSVNGSSAVLPAYTPIWLEVKRQNLILLPTTALAANDGRLGINVSAAAFGNTSRAALTWSNPVGVLYYSELSYSTTVAGAATSLQVRLMHYCPAAAAAYHFFSLCLPAWPRASDPLTLDVCFRLSMPLGVFGPIYSWSSCRALPSWLASASSSTFRASGRLQACHSSAM